MQRRSSRLLLPFSWTDKLRRDSRQHYRAGFRDGAATCAVTQRQKRCACAEHYLAAAAPVVSVAEASVSQLAGSDLKGQPQGVPDGLAGKSCTELSMSAEANLRTGSPVRPFIRCFSARRQSTVPCWHGSRHRSRRLACLMQHREGCLRRLLVLGSEDKGRRSCFAVVWTTASRLRCDSLYQCVAV